MQPEKTRLHFLQVESLQETQALPRVPGFAEGFLSGPRQRKSLPRAALGTAVLTRLHPLPRVGPSAGWDPRHNQIFAECQPSARCAPLEKEGAPSHLGCRPLCRRLRREAVGTNATCAECPLPSYGQRRWPGFTPVDWPLPRSSWGRRQSTRLCRRPTLGTCQALDKKWFFF
jgi:hypothetical protein